MNGSDSRNIVLIGMPGSGKSTLGVLLAKALGMDFVDADILIQQRRGMLLQDIIDTDGIDAFLALEADVLSSLELSDSVISTGGSAVYSDAAMKALRRNGVTVYLSVPYSEIHRRIKNITTRGIVLREGKTLRDTYDERLPLYERYADLTIDCTGRDIEQCTQEIIRKLK